MAGLTFIVLGRPGPKGSRTVGKTKKGRTYTRPASKFEKPWEQCVSTVAGDQAAAHGQLAPPYRIVLEFARKRPKRPTWLWPSREDIDKLVRCTIDGLVKAGLLLDDRHVTDLRATEAWARSPDDEGVRITVGSARPDCYAAWQA